MICIRSWYNTLREEILWKKIISNKIKCKKCVDIIEPKSINDYKRCSCWAVAVDGDTEYLMVIGNENNYIKLSDL